VVSRDLDLLKSRGITTVLTTLNHGDEVASSGIEISSLADTWLLLRNVESNGERNRLLFVIKSRGSAHSNQVREFLLTNDGPELVDVYIGDQGVLTGSARIEHMSREGRTEETQAERSRLASLAHERTTRGKTVEDPS
jgi:circadian clock protein KaiC